MTDKPKITFLPGCFDSFEGTQEELDEFMAELQRMADSGELFELSEPLTDDVIEEMTDSERDMILAQLEVMNRGGKKNLH